MSDHHTQSDKDGAAPTRGREARFRGIFYIEGQKHHTNPRATWAEADAELKDYARRMSWVQADHVECLEGEALDRREQSPDTGVPTIGPVGTP